MFCRAIPRKIFCDCLFYFTEYYNHTFSTLHTAPGSVPFLLWPTEYCEVNWHHITYFWRTWMEVCNRKFYFTYNFVILYVISSNKFSEVKIILIQNYSLEYRAFSRQTCFRASFFRHFFTFGLCRHNLGHVLSNILISYFYIVIYLFIYWF